MTTSAADIPTVTMELVQTEGVWGGVIGNIPAGEHRSFLAKAFDPSGTLRYEGKVEDVTITPGGVTLVTLTLESTTPSTPYSNEAPIIDSVVAAPTTVAPGARVTLTASAHDPNVGDTLSFAWAAVSGTFGTPALASTNWTAPASTGLVELVLTVSDGHGAASSVRLKVRVAVETGGAVVDVRFGSAPTVVGLTASQSLLDVGEQTTLTVSAADVDGDALSYHWSATCTGTFEGATTASVRFTPTVLPAAACNNCQVSVAVSDGHGGTTHGTLALCISKDAVRHLPPVLVRSYQSSLTAKPSQQLTFELVASDPEDSALSFAWAMSTGTLSATSTGATSSRVVWTAPGCASGGGDPTVTATVTNAFGLTAFQTFTVTGLPASCSSPGWAGTGSMTSPRQDHTATLLPNGKVLVAGGSSSTYAYPAQAEIYNPDAGTWSLTGSMVLPRSSHTATLLLNGKVLVAGGYSSGYRSEAEVYDPAAGTWSSTGSMVQGRYYHTATLLPNGKVLVAGGSIGGGIYSSISKAEVYDPDTGTWSAAGYMVQSRDGHTATLLPNGKVLVAGGNNHGERDTSEVYDPSTGTWSLTGSMTQGRYFHTATLLPNGKVLVSGGYALSGASATSEVYDPATGIWSGTNSMVQGRFTHTATLLPNGKVLVSGGRYLKATSEVYDPATGTWSGTNSMVQGRYAHTATLLLSGAVLAVGGSWSSYLASAELYMP
ncbi:kelch repeat-containing protein [Archangium violaceum]|uniref:Kelch repeat-containing protein n=1 Tax=Archangium violaceum TaxID=83451 RepID=UPI0036D7DBE1